MTNITEEIASTHLGKKSTGSKFYNPNLLVAIPRIENRKQYNLDKNLPFEGFDVWHCYEFSALTENGLPVSKIIKLKYSATSEFIIESKSLKLYLNSFNMTKFGKNKKDCLNICIDTIKKDLENKLKTEIFIEFLDNYSSKTEIFKNYKNLSNYVDEKNLKIEKFKEAPELLETLKTSELKEYFLKFDSLRSNCRVTHQPDFGDIFIYYKSNFHIEESGLIKYLCSFRSEYHFHEECCEMIFKRLCDILDKDDNLFVCAIYTRRGGIDICPARWSKNFTPEGVENLLDVTKFARNGIK